MKITDVRMEMFKWERTVPITNGLYTYTHNLLNIVVIDTDDPDIQNTKRFGVEGLQIAAGVPLQCDEPEEFRTFRIGLFGLDKLKDIDRTVTNLEQALEKVLAQSNVR